jgi:hypothetical protein
MRTSHMTSSPLLFVNGIYFPHFELW